jgi:DMSO/TMAO reductase YedYZ heme-binding membrane subunit
MKLYLKIIHIVRELTLDISLMLAVLILLSGTIYPALLGDAAVSGLWKINSIAIFIVMLIRPLSDLLPRQKWLRAFVTFRKELGILSALIVLSFGVAKYISWGWGDFMFTYFSADYWRFPEATAWGHLGELVAVPLLLTSNLWSQKKLKKHWKTIQRLAYVYFFAGGYYVYVAFGATEELWFMGIVLALTIAVWAKKRLKSGMTR